MPQESHPFVPISHNAGIPNLLRSSVSRKAYAACRTDLPEAIAVVAARVAIVLRLTRLVKTHEPFSARGPDAKRLLTAKGNRGRDVCRSGRRRSQIILQVISKRDSDPDR
jgi:hypothetical protein